MYHPIKALTNHIWRSILRPAFLVGVFGLMLASESRGEGEVGPVTNGNTAEGANALHSLPSKSPGTNNTAMGYNALYHNTTGSDNTANGASALFNNTIGYHNTAVGSQALYSNTTGWENMALGFDALQSNTTGFGNIAIGIQSMQSNTTGYRNIAEGYQALYRNTTGAQNIAIGLDALQINTTGDNNTVIGVVAMESNTTGSSNTATGLSALGANTSGNNNTAYGFLSLVNNVGGNNNIALGYQAGVNLTTGDNNIDIGNPGNAGEASTIRIGNPGDQTATFIAGINGVPVTGMTVVVDSNGQLGTVASSERFKTDIKPMDTASEAIFDLKPVTFRYKREVDPNGIAQFGLVAEEVEKINPDLVARDSTGKIYSVRYEAVNAMLLNEFLKERRKVKDLEDVVRKQQGELTDFARQLKEQATAIQKVGAQVEAKSPQPRVVDN